MIRREICRRLILIMLAVSIIGLFCGCWLALKNHVPKQMYVAARGEIPELFGKAYSWMISEKITELDDEEQTGNEKLTGGESAAAGEHEKDVRDLASAKETQTDRGPDAGDLEAASPLAAGDGNTPSASGENRGIQGSLDRIGESYRVEYSLFGKIPLAETSVSVVSRAEVYAGGKPIGIYMETDGVMVVDTDRVTAVDGEEYAPAANILKSGDYIRAADGVVLKNKEELIDCFNNCGGSDVVLDVTRNGEDIRLKVTPVQTGEHDYKAGIWVRNDTQGIGTLTYVEESGRYGALGHGISDVDTGKLLRIKEGVLYDTDVISVVRGTQGSPGELAGIIHYSDGYAVGTIEKNQENGIYGQISGLPYFVGDMKKYETAYRHEVEPGKASILCTVDGKCREYGIEIEEIRINGKDVNKGMVIRVTDGELLGLTGGIVQGMSGSPIIQNERIVGAVTHVFVNDPTKGYGIFIENMLGQ